MTAIAAVFGPRGAAESVVRAMQARMRGRGEDPVSVYLNDDAAIGVTRFAWERDADLAGPFDLVRHHGLVVAADASLYYRDQLRERLAHAGAAVSGPTAAHLILDAYRVWGDGCVRHLEGDFAFVVWDARRGSAFCCRDGIGLRPLYYAVVDGTLVVASSAAGVLAHPHVSSELNLRAIAAVVAGQQYSLGAETSFREVHVLAPGTSLQWRSGRTEGPARWWTPRPARAVRRLGFDAAAEQLRALLTSAVAERMPRTGTAAVWMSGGWDSTSVFAAGRHAVEQGRSSAALRPISISYPEGDPGREDDLIRAVLTRWNAEATWLDSRAIALLDAPERAAAERDEAAALLYGPWNGALAAASRASGARIAFDGNGGDQLFGGTLTYLADLLGGLRWPSLARELWNRRAIGWRHLARFAVLPLMPRAVLPATAWLRPSRRPLAHYLERAIPSWVERPFLEREGVLDLEHDHLPPPGPGIARREQHWMITAPYVGWGMSRIAERALAEGVELRSPLLDPRIIEFALARPWHERASRGESKRLLRTAMRGLLPDAVLAPRAARTGITTGYSRSWMKQRLPTLTERVLNAPLELERAGIVNAAALRRAAEQFAGGWVDDFTRVNLYQAIEVELWLRAQLDRFAAGPEVAPAVSRGREEAVAPRRSLSSHLTPLGG